MEMNPDLIYTVTSCCSWPDLELWCRFNVGAWNEEWYRIHPDIMDSLVNGDDVRTTFHFRTSEQATLFALRWS